MNTLFIQLTNLFLVIASMTVLFFGISKLISFVNRIKANKTPEQKIVEHERKKFERIIR